MKYTILILSFFLVSCLGNHSTMQTENKCWKDALFTIDMSKEYPVRQFTLEDIAQVEYIPLETNDSVLVNGYPDIISENYIVTHNQDGTIITFDRKGRFLYKFNHTGGSGEEYTSIMDLCLDNDRKEIYVLEFGLICSINRYSLDGKFKNKIKLPQTVSPTLIMNYDTDYLLCYSNVPEVYGALRENFLKPYFYLSKETGEISFLNIPISKKISNAKLINNDSEGHCEMAELGGVNSIINNGHEFIISDFASDTVYSIKERIPKPMAIRTPSKSFDTDSSLGLSIYLLTDKRIGFLVTEIGKIGTGNMAPPKLFIYDRELNEYYRFAVYSNGMGKIVGIGNDNCLILKNHAYDILEAETLVDYYAKGKLSGQLKEIASKLNSDDNPVIMLAKFKE